MTPLAYKMKLKIDPSKFIKLFEFLIEKSKRKKRMLTVETISKIRRMRHIEKKGFKTIARQLRLSKNTVKKVIKEDKTAHHYRRSVQPYRVLGAYVDRLISRLTFDQTEPKRRQRTAKKLYLEICHEGYQGSYESVNNFVRKWKLEHKPSAHHVYVPLEFEAGEAFQFDWSEEEIELAGKLTRIKVAHIRLAHSRFFLTIAYPNEQLEMVMDAHDQAFRFFGGCCRKGIYDNMKTAVQKILVGKNRQFNTRFAELASHYLFEPIACTPSAGWEKGQVENQVSTSRCNFFSPLRRVNTLDELNVQLQQDCLEWAKSHRHPEIKEKTVWQMYQLERQQLIPCRSSFDSYKIDATTVSSYSLVNFDTNAYSVDCCYVGKPVEVRIYAQRIAIYYNEKNIGCHTRCFERYKRIYNPWHYVSALKRKPGALRNGAPFQQLKLPRPITNIRQALSKYSDGDKQFIKLLLSVKQSGLAQLSQACEYALEQGTCNADIILSYVSSQGQKENRQTSQVLRLNNQVGADPNCAIYDRSFLTGSYKNEDDRKEVTHAT